MRLRKSKLVAELLPQLRIVLPEKDVLNPAALFQHRPNHIWLEVGFGGGEHLAAQAKAHPHLGLIGCEPFLNGVASLLEHIDDHKLQNIRILHDDARKLMDILPDASIDRCFILYADPWPKARHVERRFINPANLPRLARILKPGAEVRLATDVAPLAEWSKDVMDGAADFTRVHHDAAPPLDWVPTRYEEKGIKAGRTPVYMAYRRK